MKLQFIEYSSPSLNSGLLYEIEEVLLSKRSKFQKIDFYKTKDYGVLFTLDNIVMLTEKDEFFYHEMITHPAIVTHKNPENLLIIGGGDCGTLTQAAKHKNINNLTMVEIDKEVVEASKKFLPALTKVLDQDKRVNLLYKDGFKYIKENKNKFDIIIVDSTDPETIANDLFSGDFYKSCANALKDDGIFVAQTEPPFHDTYIPVRKKIFDNLKKHFKFVNFILFPMPCYPTGYFSVVLASKKYDPLSLSKDEIKEKIKGFNLKYYNEDIHFASLAVPEFMKKDLGL